MKTLSKHKKLILMLVLQALLFAVLLAPEPQGKLFWNGSHLLHLGLACGFIRAHKPWSQWWRSWVLAFSGSQLVFLFAYYALRDSASTVYLAGGWIPLIVWGGIAFIRWNMKCLKDPQSIKALGFSALGWGLLAAAYPPLPLGPGGLIFLAPWFLVLWRAPERAALFATFWSGFLFNALSYYWIYNVVKVGPGPIIMAGLFLLISYFSLYNTLAGWIFLKIRNLKGWSGKILILLFPIFWAALETTRTRGDFSFPWSPVGLIFGNQVQWLQALTLIGVFGYSALIIASNLSVAYALLRRRWAFALIPIAIFAALWGHGTWVLSHPEAQPFFISNPADTLRVGMVQPSIHQTKKWSRAYFDTVMNKTWSMVDTLATPDLDLLVLPETAIPDFIKMRRQEQKKLHDFAQQKGVSVFIGALDHDNNAPPPRRRNYYNSGFYFDTLGHRLNYRKIHLVPFSERLPFDDVFPLLNYVDLGEGDFTPGDTLPVFMPGAWTPMICYEAIYGNLMRQAARQGARLIVNITNDGWFGRSTAPGQHLNLIRYRAIETGLPVARNANSGISAFIDARGHYAENTELFTEAVIRKTIPLSPIPTFYLKIGDAVESILFGFFFAFLLVVALLYKYHRKN